MARIKYDSSLLGFMQIFEKITRSKLKDMIPGEDKLLFIVAENQISRAIGKKGSNVRTLEAKFNKKIKIAEYSDDIAVFVRNLLYPLNPVSIDETEGVVTIESGDTKTKALLIGRNSRNLTFLKETVKRFHKITDIKIN